MKEIIIPIAILAILVAGITVSLMFYFRFLQHRTEAKAMSEYRDLVERMMQNQEQSHAQLTELTARVSAVEQLLRSVG